MTGEKSMLVPPFGATSYADIRKCKAIQEITLGFPQAEPDKTQVQVVYYEVNPRKFGKGKEKWDREGKRTNKGFIIKQAVTGDN